MGWITHAPKTHTSTVTNAFEDGPIFPGSGITTNTRWHFEEPSGSALRIFNVVGSTDGTNWATSTGANVVALATINGAPTELLEPGIRVFPYYKVRIYTSAGPKTFTITMTEEI